MKKLELAGKKFGRLTVRDQALHEKGRHARWNCVCECGTLTVVRGSSLVREVGPTLSCGCLIIDTKRAEKTTHGLYWHPSYATWNSMMNRCFSENDANWRDYGGRGITVCERWRQVEHFIADMGIKPPGLSLDRINVNGNYEPANCRWATDLQQANNTRTNVRIAFEGREQTASEWARELGLKASTITQRLRRGHSVARALGKNT